MQAITQNVSRKIIIGKINFKTTEAMSCFQIREKLDALFGGDSRLEETHAAVKRILFEHLENCVACCRSFDVRLRFRSTGRDTIY